MPQLGDYDRTVKDKRFSAPEIGGRIGFVSKRIIHNRLAAPHQNEHIVIGTIPCPSASNWNVRVEFWINVEPGKVGAVAAQARRI